MAPRGRPRVGQSPRLQALPAGGRTSVQVFTIGFQTSYTFPGLIAHSAETKAQAEFLGLTFEAAASVGEAPDFIHALQEAVDSSSLVFVLDGSEDFITKKKIAKGLGLPLEENPKAREAVERYCRQTGRAPAGRLLEGALLPRGAVPMTSGDTVDQGFILTRGSRCVAVFPASKKGFGSMFAGGMLPFLVQSAGLRAHQEEITLLPGKEEPVGEYLQRVRPGKGVFPALFTQNGQSFLRVTAVRKSQEEAASACASLLEDLTSEAGKIDAALASARQQKKAAKAAQKLEKQEGKSQKKKKSGPYEDYAPQESGKT